MSVFSRKTQYIIRKARTPFRRFRLWFKHRLGWLGVPVIQPFTGYCNGKEVWLGGMVTEDKGLEKPRERQSRWQNMLAMIKRYVGDEISGVEVEVSFQGFRQVVETDENGIFQCILAIDGEGWLESGFLPAHYRLLDRIVEDQPETTAAGEVMMVTGQPRFGVISDIDDTVMVSHSTVTLKKLRLMLTKNALTRVPFPGVSAFYSALQANGSSPNPFFYVSSSEWNLFDLLEDFFRFRKIPKGPFLLQDLEYSIFKFWKSGGGNHQHKLDKITRLLHFFPDLKFILIGDSGQRDPFIYQKVVEAFPGRIKAIYIRCIGKGQRNPALQDIINEMKEREVPMLLVKDTRQASRHALENGFISPATVADINEQQQVDEKQGWF